MRSRKILAIPAVAAVLVVWFLVASRDAARTSFMDAKVKTALEIGMQDVALNGSRVRVTSVNGAKAGYYVPDINSHRELWFVVYKDALGLLNLESTPLFKMTDINMDSDLDRVIDAHATVQFEVLPGITKTIVVSASIQAPHYKNPTGATLTT
jgi:hypothetical protein